MRLYEQAGSVGSKLGTDNKQKQPLDQKNNYWMALYIYLLH